MRAYVSTIGKSKAVPSSMFVYGLAAGGGQVAVNLIAGQRRVDEEQRGRSWFSSPWSPLQKLSDEEYVSMMQEKILRVDADIALIDDRIAKLREKQQEERGES
jgi:hypothetical protein